jgi:serine protease Do
MLEEARDGVLGIQVTTDESAGTGSGVIYKQEGNTYYMVTNDHVLVHEDDLGNRYLPTDIQIVYEKNGILFTISNENVTYLGSDPVTDLGVVTFTTDETFSVIPLADSYQVEPGQFVFALGNPLGFDYYGTVTMGVVSGAARYYQDGDFDATLLQHDAAISPGNSGGALLNVNGELIGINNMKLITEYVSNIGFAIPSNTVARITADLEDDGIVTRPYLGISTYAQINECGLDFGVCLSSVQDGGAAENAGLEIDDVIVAYKNEGMTEYKDVFNFNDLKEAILNSSIGEQITVMYYRDVDNNGSYDDDELFESQTATLNVHPDDQN